MQSDHPRLEDGLIACRRALPDIADLAHSLLAEHRKRLELAGALEPVAVLAEAPARPAAWRRARKPAGANSARPVPVRPAVLRP